MGRRFTVLAVAASAVVGMGLVFWVHSSRADQAMVASNVPSSPSPLVTPATQPADNQDAQHQVAAAEMDLGEQSLKAGQPSDAIAHFKSVINSGTTDDALVAKAKDELAAAQADLAKQVVAASAAPAASASPAAPAASPAPASPLGAVSADQERAIYDQATNDLKSARYEAARDELQQLIAAGYTAPLFHRSPQDLLAEIPANTAVALAPGDMPTTAPTDATPAIPSAEATTTPATDTSMAVPATEPTAAATTEPTAAMTPTTEPAAAAAPTVLDRLQAESANEKLAQEQKRFRARGLVDLARQAYADGDKQQALEDYSQAADLDPDNQQATAGKQQLLVETGRAAAVPAGGELRGQLSVEIQDIQFRFSSAIRDAKTAVAADDFATAQRRLEDARVARSIDPGIFPQEQLREMDATIAQVDQAMKDEKQAYEQRTAQSAQSQIEETEKARAQEQRDQLNKTVANLIHLCEQEIDAKNYEAALGVLDHIATLDPNNPYLGVRQFVEDRAILQEQRKYRETYDLEWSRQLNAAEEEKIPYDDIIRYPSNWPDISESRDEEVQAERGLTREDQATQALLDKVLPPTNFEGTTFTEAIDYFRDVTGANIFVNTKALDAAGVDRATALNLKFNNVKFSKALDLILAMVGGQTKLSYDIDEGVISISTADQLNQNVSQEVYDIRDLLVDIPNFQLQDVTQVASGLSTGGGGGTVGGGGAGGGGGSGLGSSSSSSTGSFSGGGGTQGMQRSNQALMDEVVKLVTDNIASDTWKTNGGTIGAVSELVGSGQIVVTQTPENQRKLVDLLDKIREKREIMVTVEARFLTVGRHFIENVGLNLDAVFNTNQGPNSVFSTVPVHVLDNNFTAGISTGAPGSIGTSATPASLAFTYLDDFQVNFMIQAVEASQNNTLVNAPRVTVFDGGTAVLFVGTTFDYVSNLVPTVGSGGAVGYTATISSGFTGVAMSVKATVSADRKYVTLQLQPTLTAPPVFTPFSIATATAPTATGNGTVITNAVTETIQLISQEVTSVETLVSVPDGGTLLMGGQTIAAEAEAEQGIPVLSKIPFLKRLFTNTAMARDEQVVLILVKPTILIQREQEDKAFPLLSENAAGQ